MSEQTPISQIESRPLYLRADQIQDVAEARELATDYASLVLEQNRQLTIEGEFDSIPLPIDPLGTAARAIEAEERFGRNSLEYQDVRNGLFLECQRLYGEAYRKNAWEYFPQSLQSRDESSGHYSSSGLSLRLMVEAGLSPLAHPEEQARRMNEYVEEITYEKIGGLALDGLAELATEGQSVSVITLSECTDWAIDAYQSDSKASHGGYVPEINKLMIRGVLFVGPQGRLEEQLGVAGTYISHEVIVAALQDMGQLSETDNLSKTELHGVQLVDQNGGGVIEFVKLLDQKASDLSGLDIFLGEPVNECKFKDYDQIEREAGRRRLLLRDKSQELADYLIDLKQSGIDRWLIEGLVSNHVKEVLLKMAEVEPAAAEIMFDKATADGFKLAESYREAGRYEEARLIKDWVSTIAPAPDFCGAGSCGLETLRNGHEKDRAVELGLDEDGELIKDKERACPKCHHKSVVYEIKKSGFKKACTSCGAVESRS